MEGLCRMAHGGAQYDLCITLAVTYFRMGTPKLSSAMTRFTSEFGMGSGGSMSLWPPGKTVELKTLRL